MSFGMGAQTPTNPYFRRETLQAYFNLPDPIDDDPARQRLYQHIRKCVYPAPVDVSNGEMRLIIEAN